MHGTRSDPNLDLQESSRHLAFGLPVGEHVHLNGFDRLSLPVHHATNSFRGVSTEHRFAAVSTDGCGNLLNPHEPAINIKNLAHKFLTALRLPAHMTVKHGYLRR